MGGGVNLHRRAEQREVAYRHLAHIQHHAVEIEEHALAEIDIRAVIAEKRRLHPHALPALAEEFHQDTSSLLLVGFAGGVEILTEISRPVAGVHELWIEWVIEFACQHFFAFASHLPSSLRTFWASGRRQPAD